MVVCGAAYYALCYLHNDSRLCTLLVGRFAFFTEDEVGDGNDLLYGFAVRVLYIVLVQF